MIYRAARLPGPGQYRALACCAACCAALTFIIRYDIDKDKGKSGGGKFSTANPKSDVEWRMYLRP